jgi:endonuclease III
MAPRLRDAISALRTHYGSPKPPVSTDPFELVLHENLAYLASDEKRLAALNALRRNVGTTPRAILVATMAALVRVCRVGGIYAELRAERLRRSAEIVVTEFDGDLRNVLRLPQREARKALKRFPAIGEPGADKILLFTGTYPVLAPDSNGLRVLTRLGLAREESSYAATYRLALTAIAQESGNDCRGLVAAHQLLRRHGQELCRRTQPECERCPLRASCDYYGRL